MDEKNKLKLSSKIINVYPKPTFLQVLKMPLKEIAKNTNNQSLNTNIELALSNIRLGAQIAKKL